MILSHFRSLIIALSLICLTLSLVILFCSPITSKESSGPSSPKYFVITSYSVSLRFCFKKSIIEIEADCCLVILSVFPSSR